jgi:hypothetical protein
LPYLHDWVPVSNAQLARHFLSRWQSSGLWQRSLQHGYRRVSLFMFLLCVFSHICSFIWSMSNIHGLSVAHSMSNKMNSFFDSSYHCDSVTLFPAPLCSVFNQCVSLYSAVFGHTTTVPPAALYSEDLKQDSCLKHFYLSKLHSVRSQKSVVLILTTAGTQNLKHFLCPDSWTVVKYTR